MKHFFPKLIATLTRTRRELVVPGKDFSWRQKDGMLLITNVLFRSWETVAGRRAGIRPGAAVAVDDTGPVRIVVARKFFTLESVLAHFEAELRLAWRKDPVLVAQTAFAFASVLLTLRIGQPDHLPIWVGAIAFGAANGSSSNITSSGSNIMVIGGICNIAGDLGTVKFNLVNANQIDHVNFSVTHDGYTYMLKAQAATSTWSGAGSSNWNVSYYTGVAQNDTAGTVDNHGTTTGNSTAPSGSLTPNSSNCFVWCNISSDAGAATISAWTNMANHVGQASPSSAPEDSGDSGLVASPSSQTQSETMSVGGHWGVMQISMAPPAVPATGGFFAIM